MTKLSSHSCGALALTVGALAASALPATGHGQTNDVDNAQCSDGPIDAAFDYIIGGIFGESAKNHAGIPTIPRAKVLVPAAQRAGLVEKRIVFFGDMFAFDKDMAPRVRDDIRAIFTRADLVVGNVEAPITDENNGLLETNASQFYNFHANVPYVKSVMAQFCIDPAKAVFTVANNHANDKGRWKGTVEHAPKLGATIVGLDRSDDPTPDITVKDVGGLRVGIVGWTALQNTTPPVVSGESLWYPTWETSRRVEARSDWNQRKTELGIDLLIGIPHWDCQWNMFPHRETVEVAEMLHENGIDLINGTHGSLQPGAIHNDSALGIQNELTFYNMGTMNLGPYKTRNMLVSVIEVTVDESGRVLEYEVHPYLNRKGGQTFTRGIGQCGARWAYDWARTTDYEIVSFEWLRANGDAQDKRELANIEKYLDKVYPK